MSDEINKSFYKLMLIIGILLIITAAIAYFALGPIIAFPSILGFFLICYGCMKLTTEFPEY